jgi:DNA-binding transcriptional MerR regulator
MDCVHEGLVVFLLPAPAVMTHGLRQGWTTVSAVVHPDQWDDAISVLASCQIGRAGQNPLKTLQGERMAYTVKQAADLAGLSVSGVKTYGVRYEAFLSPSANPGPGLSRSYTPQDVAKLRMIGSLQKQGTPHADIMTRLESGESGEVPDDASQNVTDGPQQAPQQQAALALIGPVLQALQQRLDDAQRREDALQDRLLDAERRAAVAEARLEDARRPFWKRLFGG